MTRIAAVTFSVLFVLSCTSAPKPDVTDTERPYPASFDRAWRAVTIVLEDHGWPIETANELSGTIATEFATVGVNRDKNACPVFVGDNRRINEMRCKLVVHLVSISEFETEIRVNAILEGKVVAMYTSGSERFVKWTACSSTGTIEKEILDAVANEL
jgi:hypothetical protein